MPTASTDYLCTADALAGQDPGLELVALWLRRG